MRRVPSALIAGGSVLAVVAALTGGTGNAAPAPRPETAHVWITTPDGSELLADRGTVAFGGTPSSAPTIVVDPSRTFQTMTGFGASITDSSASVLYTLPAAARTAAMASLFDPRTGDGLDFLRQPIGASDFTTGPAYTYDDVPAGQTDYALAHFSVAHDQAEILPLLREARRLNPAIQVLGTPWSPPAWMKTGDSLVGGRLIDDPRVYHAYAAYLLAFVQAYRANGVPVDYLTVQNEPQNRAPAGYPGTDLPSWQEAKVIAELGPMLRHAGLPTRILGYDHNWSEHPSDVASTPPDETADVNDYPRQLLSSGAARYLAGIAYHCYYGDPSDMSALHRQYPNEDIYFTECSGTQSSDPSNTFSDTLKWHARNLILGNTRNWAKTVVNWNIALDAGGGPHTGGCATCTGVLTVHPDGTVTRDAEYYTLGHLARFVKPGAVRIASTSFGTTGWNSQVMDTAFRNPDGSTVLVAHNENDDPQAVAVQYDGRTFTYTLPGGALATFVWQGGHPTAPAVDPTGWSATADPPAPTDPCCTGDVAGNAVDDDATTRYSTGAPQQPGQYLQLDLGRTDPLRRLVLDTGVSTGDFPRGYTVATSRDGTQWTVAATGAGSGQLTTVPLNGHPVRYVRVTLTAASASWWSVADVRAYTR